MRACEPASQPVSVSESVCPKEDMSPYCWAHGEWLIMKLCMYVGYHDVNNVSNFGGDPIIWAVEISFVLRERRTIAVTRPLVLRLLLRDHAGYTSIRLSTQP